MKTTSTRILYLDDQKQERGQVRDVLQLEPDAFELIEAGSAIEFEQLLRSQAFDLVLSEINLPNLSGLDVIEKVQAINALLPVIILTGSQNGHLAAGSIQRGAADFVIKSPASLSILPHKIRMVLDRLEAEQKRQEIERHFNDMAQRIPAGMYTSRNHPNGENEFEYVSPRFCEILGLDEAEILSDAKNADAIIHPEDLDNLIQTSKNARETGLPFSWEGRFMVNDQPRWLHLEAEPLFLPDGDILSYGVVMDITERVHAGQALRNSEAFNQAVISQSPIGISVFDPLGNALTVNAAWKKIWSISEEEYRKIVQCRFTEFKFEDWDDYLLPHQDQVHQVYAKGGSLYLPDLKIPHPRPGAAEWVSKYYYAILDEEGQVERVVSLTEDVSARKKVELEIIKSRTLLERVQEVTQLGSVEINLSTRTIIASAEARRIYGWEDRILALSDIQASVLPEYRLALDAALQDLLLLNKEFNLQYKIKRKSDGAIRDIQAIAEHNPAENTVVGSIQDITERKLIMQVLMDNEEKFRTLFENANEMIVMVDSRDRIVDANKYACNLLGYSRDELLKMKVTDLQAEFVRGSPDTSINQRFQGHGSNIFQSMALHKNGTSIPVEISISKISIASGVRFIAIVRDVRERRRVEQDLKKQIDQLERFSAVSVDHELRIHDLKQEVNALLLKAGGKEKYKIPDD